MNTIIIIVGQLTGALILAASPLGQAHTGGVTGRVVDARTRQPLAHVLIHAENQASVVESDENGAFTLPLPPGKYTIAASLIGYAVRRHAIDVTSAGFQELAIELSEGAGEYEEQVTVTGALRHEADNAPAGTAVYGRDLQALRGVMLDDPLRALQALPAATSTDDFYSEFAVRGSSFRHLGLAIDGIPSPYLIHSIHRTTDGGSIAMVNSEALGSASLLPGSYPQTIGRRLGAQLELSTRDGSRDRFHGRASLSGTSAGFVGEGPLADGRGGWLVSARRSYLDFLLKRIDPDGSFGFGFSDALGKVTFDINPHNQLKLLTVVGRSAFDEGPEDLGVNDDALAISRAWLSAATWRFTPTARVSLSQRVYLTGMDFHNVSKTDVTLDRGSANNLGWRTDVMYAPRDGWVAEFGGDLQRGRATDFRRRTFDGASAPLVLSDYRATGSAASAYAQLSVRVGRLTTRPGVRADYWGASATTAYSPWVTSDLALTSRTRVRGGTGIYRQFPALEHLNGLGGNSSLAPERATHVDVALSHAFSSATSAQVAAFVRDERNVLRAVGAEPSRLLNGSIVLGRGDAQWSNRLTGRARGVEVVLRRDAPTGFAGWLAYAYARHRYDDVVTGESFWSDADQRHTLSAYGLYRVTNRTSIGAKFRHGSNYPITGYVGPQQASADTPPLFGGGRPLFFTLVDQRNTLRLPAYARLDLRADRAVSWSHRRVTLFVEVANALNRRNERNVPYSVDRNGRIAGVSDSLLPILPSAGLVIEF